jgi:23S rRNA (adenine2503-C2)-methyltransferase
VTPRSGYTAMPKPASDQPTRRYNLLDLDRPAMERLFVDLGEKAFHARQVLRWMYQLGVVDIQSMTDLGKNLRARLDGLAEIGLPEMAREQRSQDGTTKWMLRLGDGNCIETVFIPEEARGTLCVSSQVGCVLNCPFCATGRQGFSRNLSAAEIVAQLWLGAQRLGHNRRTHRVITNVVFMGMGEPLLNLDNVLTATRLMTDDLAWGLSKRRVTISTAGIVPAIERLAQCSDVSLAVSLHAPNDALRDTLVPVNRRYPIATLLEACWRYLGNDPWRRVTFEYVLLAGVNDSVAQARELAGLLRNTPAKLNLIPFNSFAGAAYAGPREAEIDRFRRILLDAGLTVITRKTRGEDVAAACGQLIGQVHDRTRRSTRPLTATC